MADNDKFEDDFEELNSSEPLVGVDRITVVRDAVVFQFKLVLDGLLDLVMLPLSAVGAVWTLISGDDWFYRTIRVARRADARINLFSVAARLDTKDTVDAAAGPGHSDQIDQLAARVEAEIRKEIQDGKLRSGARESINKLRRRLNKLSDDDSDDNRDLL